MIERKTNISEAYGLVYIIKTYKKISSWIEICSIVRMTGNKVARNSAWINSIKGLKIQSDCST